MASTGALFTWRTVFNHNTWQRNLKARRGNTVGPPPRKRKGKTARLRQTTNAMEKTVIEDAINIRWISFPRQGVARLKACPRWARGGRRERGSPTLGGRREEDKNKAKVGSKEAGSSSKPLIIEETDGKEWGWFCQLIRPRLQRMEEMLVYPARSYRVEMIIYTVVFLFVLFVQFTLCEV